jgi:hypothetical protein
MTRGRAVRALAAVCVLVTVSTVGRATQARAAAPGVDQITGNGETASAVTASWSQGLLGADNRTVVAPRDPSSSLAFMYDDFKNLNVTVSQTQSLVNQAVKVSWSGGKQTIGNGGNLQGDFLQVMQCYGDANAGPDPEDCEYGSKGLLPGGALNPQIQGRAGIACVPGSVPSTDLNNMPDGADGSFRNNGCDTREPTDASHDSPHNFGIYSVPFVPVGTTDRLYQDAGAVPDYTNYYDRFSTNEVQAARTGADGTGQLFFQMLTTIEAPGLGCGAVRSDGTPRDCWLVVVPRGEYKANGYKIDSSDSSSINFLNDSPLGASNWAQRIQIHLNFAPVATNCAIGSAGERETVGTQVVSHAMFSWQLALNHAAHCATIYGYTEVPESTNTSQLTDPSSGVGLAFTTIPIGAEGARKGAPAHISLPLVYAPVAVSALTLGFNINLNNSGGFVATPIKLTPRLLAKALTQSYRFDLPDVDNRHPGPKWAEHNPDFITTDPEFTKLNPGVHTPPASNPLAPLLTEDLSALNQQVWAWIDSDKAARDWLSGKPDENGMVINPHYNSKTLKLYQTPIDSFPRADPTCFNTGDVGEREPGRCSLNLLPYVNDYTDAATRIRTGNNPEGSSWDQTVLAPDGQLGWWGNGGIEPAGQQFLWGVTDSASLAGLGLVPASLCNAAGKQCVGPNASSLSTALANAKPDSTGVLHVDPAHPGGGGYPLVDVTYAAARLDQPAAARNDYAALIQYGATTGQTPGVDPGQLPHGYLPLPGALRNQAVAATAELRCGQGCPTNHPGGPTSPPQPGANGGGNPVAPGSTGGTGTSPGGTNGTSGTGGSGGAGGPGSTPGGAHSKPPSTTARPGSTPGNGLASPGPAQLAGKSERTPGTPIGGLRWALLVIAIAGLVGAVAVPLSRTDAFPRLLRTLRRQA